MLNASTIEALVEKVGRSLPAGGQSLAEDLKKNLHVALNSALQRMDLVTREEFDVQSELLARTRTRLEALEETVATMESKQSN
jgi:hypothetical protein